MPRSRQCGPSSGEAVEGRHVQVLHRSPSWRPRPPTSSGYLAPPENAIVLGVEEKSQMQEPVGGNARNGMNRSQALVNTTPPPTNAWRSATGSPRTPGSTSTSPRPLAPAQPGRGLVRHHRTPSHPSRQLPLRPRPDDQDPGLHQRLEPASAPVHLDQTPDEILDKINRTRRYVSTTRH
jgi:hypothetical protein